MSFAAQFPSRGGRYHDALSGVHLASWQAGSTPLAADMTHTMRFLPTAGDGQATAAGSSREFQHPGGAGVAPAANPKRAAGARFTDQRGGGDASRRPIRIVAGIRRHGKLLHNACNDPADRLPAITACQRELDDVGRLCHDLEFTGERDGAIHKGEG